MTAHSNMKSKACIACPFRDGETMEATQGQNWGCLPSSFEMTQAAQSMGVALSCHDDCKSPCKGLVEAIPEASTMPVKSYSDWYENGWISNV